MITIKSVGGKRSAWPLNLPGSAHVRRRTAVMAMTALPVTQVGPSIPTRPRPAKDGQPYPMQADATQ